VVVVWLIFRLLLRDFTSESTKITAPISKRLDSAALTACRKPRCSGRRENPTMLPTILLRRTTRETSAQGGNGRRNCSNICISAKLDFWAGSRRESLLRSTACSACLRRRSGGASELNSDIRSPGKDRPDWMLRWTISARASDGTRPGTKKINFTIWSNADISALY
jgi:hypothetical protein